MPTSWRTQRRTAICAAVVATALALSLSTVASSTTTTHVARIGPTVALRPPLGALSDLTLADVACASATSCVAVGRYVASATRGLPFVAAGSITEWGRARAVALPSGHAGARSTSGLEAVACPAVAACVAVGGYEDTARDVEPMATTEQAGTWSSATRVALPPSAGTNQTASLDAISCPSVGTCVAVGTFTDGEGGTQPMVATSSSGSWSQAVELTLPSDAGSLARSLGAVALDGVSCRDVADCVAVGSYLDGAGGSVPMRLTESKGTWSTAVRVRLALRTSSTGNARLTGVSCTTTSCTAVGFASTAGGTTVPIVSSTTAGRWGDAFAVRRARGVLDAAFEAVACARAERCTAVGWFTGASHALERSILDVEANGRWLGGQPSSEPTTQSGTSSTMATVACPGVDLCVAGGTRRDLGATGAILREVAELTSIVPVGVVLVPAAPGRPDVVPRPSAIRASWVQGSNGGSRVTSFTATAAPGSAHCSSVRTSCVIDGVSNGTRYVVRVAATNVRGTSHLSVASATVVPGTVPTSPDGLVVALRGALAQVRWRAALASSGDPVLRYVATVSSRGRPVRQCVTARRTCSFGALATGRLVVRVVARNAVGSSPPSRPVTFVVR